MDVRRAPTGSSVAAEPREGVAAEPREGVAAEPREGVAAVAGASGGRSAARRRSSRPPSAARLLKGVLTRYSVVLVWALMIVIFTIAAPGKFLTTGTFQTIFGQQQALVFLALALICTFAVGEFDLIVASILGLAATLVPVLTSLHHVPLPVSCLIAVGASVLAGLVNGVVVVLLGINPIVTTLGMGTLLEGVALWSSHLSSVGGLSLHSADVANTHVLGLPISFFYGLALTLVFSYVMFCTPLGRHMAFVGANREVSRLAGIHVQRLRIGGFVFAGLICGVGGVILVLGLGGFDPNASATYLLPAFAATFLGTAIVAPGKFNPLGAFLAIYFLVTGIIGLQLLGYTGWISDVFFGLSLVVAVAISTITRRRTLLA